MDFTFLVQNIITKYMTNLDEKGYEEPRKIVFDGLYNDLQYVYRCGQLSINTGIKQDLKPEPRSWSVKMPEIPQPDHEIPRLGETSDQTSGS